MHYRGIYFNSMFNKSTHDRVVTRFAPSPTGFMHVGSVRTALFAYLFARKHKGTFILRIEDTDKAREVEGSIDHIMETLRWVGIEWDHGPDTDTPPFGSVIQSERLDTYREFAEKLIAKGLAYPDPFTREEVDEFREDARKKKRPFLFRDYRPENPGVWDGAQPLRFKVPRIERTEWYDEVRGYLEAGEEALDDFILMKSDGYPTYNFAHIVDDFCMGVTHIMRADEFISSTPRFLALYEALGITPPKLVTLPPILRTDRKKKMGKRDGAKDMLEYREDGFLSDAVVNFLALTGWNPGTDQEVFTREELIEAFDIEGIQTAGAILNDDKLLWMNREHILRMSDEDFAIFVRLWVPEELQKYPQWSDERLTKLLPTIKERINTGGDIREQFETGEYDYFFASPELKSEMLRWKNDTHARDALPRLRYVAEVLSALDEENDITTLHDAIFPYAEQEGKGEVLWPLRVALSGRERSPDPFTLMYVLGSAEAYRRVQHACDVLLHE